MKYLTSICAVSPSFSQEIDRVRISHANNKPGVPLASAVASLWMSSLAIYSEPFGIVCYLAYRYFYPTDEGTDILFELINTILVLVSLGIFTTWVFTKTSAGAPQKTDDIALP